MNDANDMAGWELARCACGRACCRLELEAEKRGGEGLEELEAEKMHPRPRTAGDEL